MLLHHLYQRCPGRGLPPTCLRTFAVALFFFFFQAEDGIRDVDRKSTRLNSSHGYISYAVFCLEKKITRLNSHPDYISNALLFFQKNYKEVRVEIHALTSGLIVLIATLLTLSTHWC